MEKRTKLRRGSIRLRIVATTAVVGALSVTLIVTLLTTTARQQLLEEAIDAAIAVNDSLVEDIDRWEEVITATAHVVTGNPGIQAMDSEIHRQAIPAAFSALDAYAYTMYSIDATGMQFITHTGERGNGNRSDRVYYTGAIEGNEVARQIVMGRSLTPPSPAVAFGFPIRNETAPQPVGVFLIATTLTNLSEVLAGRVDEHQRAYVVSPEGILVGHSDRTMLDQDQLTDATAFPAVAEALSGGQAGTLFEYQNGEQTLMSYHERAKNGWLVFFEIDKQVVMAPANRLSLIGFIIGIVGIIVVTAILLPLTVAILSPLHTLSARLEMYAKSGGDLTERLEVKRRDEIGNVALAFNAFVESLGVIITKIRSAVDNVNHQQAVVAQNSTETAAATKQIAQNAVTSSQEATALEETSHSMVTATGEVHTASQQLETCVSQQAAGGHPIIGGDRRDGCID